MANPADSSGDTTPRRRPPVSKSRQAIVLVIGLALVVGVIALGAVYQEDTTPAEPVFSGSPADGGGARPDDPNAPVDTLNVTPIEGWFPRSGQGSTCSEPVGVDLLPGYGAILSINGSIVPEEMLNDPSSATRSIGQYLYGPEEDCPNGALLRPKDNQVQACIYRVENGPASCTLSEVFSFDAL